VSGGIAGWAPHPGNVGGVVYGGRLVGGCCCAKAEATSASPQSMRFMRTSQSGLQFLDAKADVNSPLPFEAMMSFKTIRGSL